MSYLERWMLATQDDKTVAWLYDVIAAADTHPARAAWRYLVGRPGRGETDVVDGDFGPLRVPVEQEGAAAGQILGRHGHGVRGWRRDVVRVVDVRQRPAVADVGLVVLDFRHQQRLAHAVAKFRPATRQADAEGGAADR